MKRKKCTRVACVELRRSVKDREDRLVAANERLRQDNAQLVRQNTGQIDNLRMLQRRVQELEHRGDVIDEAVEHLDREELLRVAVKLKADRQTYADMYEGLAVTGRQAAGLLLAPRTGRSTPAYRQQRARIAGELLEAPSLAGNWRVTRRA